MVDTFQKKSEISLSEHFSSFTFDCNCNRPACSVTLIDSRLPGALEQLWDLIGPFKITSGFRCEAHNKEIGGVLHSQHCLGLASDVKSTSGLTGAKIASRAECVPLFFNGGIGVYPTFCHVDIRATGHAIWFQKESC